MFLLPSPLQMVIPPMELVQDFLRIHPLLNGLTPQEIEQVAEFGVLRTVETGEYLFQDQDALDSIYLVHAGRVALEVGLPNGQYSLVTTVGSGGQIGAVAVLTGHLDLHLRARVEERARLIELSAASIDQLLNDLPVLRRNFLRSIGESVARKYVGTGDVLVGRLVTCFAGDENSRQLLPEVVERLLQMGETVAVLSDQPKRFACHEALHMQSFHDNGSDWLSDTDVRQVAAGWANKDRIFMEVGPDIPGALLQKLIRVTHQTWWMSGTDSAPALLEQIRPLVALEPAWRDKGVFLWLLAARARGSSLGARSALSGATGFQAVDCHPRIRPVSCDAAPCAD